MLDVRPDPQGGSEKWLLTSLNLRSQETKREVYDAVIMANGRYDSPYMPDIPGLDAWKATYPTTILYSKFYRNPKPFTEKVKSYNNDHLEALN